MRKRIIAPMQQEAMPPDEEWLELERLAEVEITSQDAAHPIESALLPGRASLGQLRLAPRESDRAHAGSDLSGQCPRIGYHLRHIKGSEAAVPSAG